MELLLPENVKLLTCRFVGHMTIRSNSNGVAKVEVVRDGLPIVEEWKTADLNKGFRCGEIFFGADWDLRAAHHSPMGRYVPNILCPTQLLHPAAKPPIASGEFAMGHDICCVGGLDGLENPDKWSSGQRYEWQRLGELNYTVLDPGRGFLFRTGFKQAIQPGWGCLLWDRSGMGGSKLIHRLAGVIDEDYRGEWFVRLINLSQVPQTINVGDKIIQGVYQERVRALCPLVESLEETERGTKGFGSTGS